MANFRMQCRVLRYYVTVNEQPLKLEILVRFCLEVYFPTWFEIKGNKHITHGPRSLFNLIQQVLNFSDRNVRKIAPNVVIRNGYSAHPENIMIAMLVDDNEDIRNKGVTKVLAFQKHTAE